MAANGESRPSSSLTVELPIKSESDESDSAESASLEVDEINREVAGFNSPKRNDPPTLALEDDGLDDDNDVPTPVQREQYGINSPRRSQLENGWAKANEATNANGGAAGQTDNDNGDSSAALSALVTQVSQDDNPITSVSRPASDNNEDEHQTEAEIRRVSQSNWGVFTCCQCIFSPCINNTQPEEPPKEKPAPTAYAEVTPSSQAGADDEINEVIDEIDYDNSLLGRPLPRDVGQKCLVLDLDETLVHSSFKPVPNCDFIIPVEIDNVTHRVYVMKRPYADEFLLRTSKHYEIVVFTASLAKYANPLLDQLDPNGLISHRLFRESCVIHHTAYVKDLSRMGRPINQCIIIDNSPQSYLFQPTNAVPILTWFDDMNDTQLLDILPVLETTLKDIPDVRKLLDANSRPYNWLCNQANKTEQFS